MLERLLRRRAAWAPLALLLGLGPVLGCNDGAARAAPADDRGPAPAETQAEPTAPSAHRFDVEQVASGLDRPVYVGAAPGDDGALWVLEQPGRVLRLADGGVGADAVGAGGNGGVADGGVGKSSAGGRPTVALDLSAEVLVGAEQGLLGIAFHPGFATNRRVFLHWSDRQGRNRVAEFRASPDGTQLEPAPVRDLLALDHPEENHYGGQLAFGPDGRLYLGLGDGGGAFDPRGAAQDPDQLLGKLVAVDVDAPEPSWQVVLRGLRNPWRFSFDPALAEVWIPDVGQDEVEEVNRVALELDEPPKNLGWSAFEGDRPLPDHELVPGGDLIAPVATYGRADGCAVIGGVVYSGTGLPSLNRRYVYGDYCSGALWSLQPAPGSGATQIEREEASVPLLTHIGTDGRGELVFASGTGTLYRAVPPG